MPPHTNVIIHSKVGIPEYPQSVTRVYGAGEIRILSQHGPHAYMSQTIRIGQRVHHKKGTKVERVATKKTKV